MKTRLMQTALLMAAQFALAAPAQSEWLTVTGDRSDPTVDTVEVDPSVEPTTQGQKMARIRVNRASPSETRDGVVYRSYEAMVIFNCPNNTARYSRVIFYNQPRSGMADRT